MAISFVASELAAMIGRPGKELLAEEGKSLCQKLPGMGQR